MESGGAATEEMAVDGASGGKVCGFGEMFQGLESPRWGTAEDLLLHKMEETWANWPGVSLSLFVYYMMTRYRFDVSIYPSLYLSTI